jgi:serine/threonine protein phosphatase PrpC
VSFPLSNDQTPFRKDERDRLKKSGARIMTIGQLEGDTAMHENWNESNDNALDDSADPPRVWDKTLERPGCAFTRSLGDQIAEYVGVIATPEVYTKSLTPKDRYIVIESDGVSEFLTNDAVLDIILKSPDDLIASAKAVVDESYKKWLQHDERTDDITIILGRLRVVHDT